MHDEKAQTLLKLQEQLLIETKIKAGAETMLQVSETSQKGATISRREVELQLNAANKKIAYLTKQMEQYKTVDPVLSRKPTGNRAPVSESKPRNSSSTNSRSPTPRGNIRRKSTISSKEVDATTAKNIKSTFIELLKSIKNVAEIPHVRLDCMNNLLKLMRNIDDVEYFCSYEIIVKSVRPCLVDPQKEMRANAFRFLRHIVTSNEIVKVIIDCHVEVFIVRTLTRDQRYDVEREQAIRFIRTCLDVSGGGEHLPQSVIRVIIAICEQPDDRFKTICLETLCEISLRNPEIVALCGGFKILIGALTDGPKELNQAIIYSIVSMLDCEETRWFIRPSVELEMILSCFTDAYGKGAAFEEKLTSSAKTVAAFLNSWTGLIYLCVNNRKALCSIIDSLKLPSNETRKIIIEMLFDIFFVEMPKWYPDFVSSRSRTAHYSLTSDEIQSSSKVLLNLLPNKRRLNLLDQYQTIILITFVEAGLAEALIDIVQTSQKFVATRATILIGELREMCNCMLPPSYIIKMNCLPKLFQAASDFEDENHRHTATLVLSNVDVIQSNKEKFLLQSIEDTLAKQWLAKSIGSKHVVRTDRQLKLQGKEVKQRIGMQIDDVSFKNLLNETEGPSIKEYTKWNWDGTIELIQGPLQNPKRLEEAIKNYKFLRRLLIFFRPFSKQFSEIKKGKGTFKYVKVGCDLLQLLLMNIDSMKFLIENKLLQEIAECLNQLDPLTERSDDVFSADKMERTLTSEYFILLGVLMKTTEGQKMLEKCRLFTTFYHVSELRNRDDLLKAMLSNMDYSNDGHNRIILSKIMTSGNKNMQLFATNHVRYLLRSSNSDASDWGIQLLITQLYDPIIDVYDNAIDVLDEAFIDLKNVDYAVKLRPTLLHLHEYGNPLLLRFLSTPNGYAYMDELGYICDVLNIWFDYGILRYVTQLEVNLSRVIYRESNMKALNDPPQSLDVFSKAIDNSDILELDKLSSIPPHFYGELTKTVEGCKLLAERGHFEKFVEVLRAIGIKNYGVEMTKKLKAILWAIGHIGSNDLGLPFLIQENIFEEIVQIAENSAILSIKGTCYYVLGLLSITQKGAKILADLGWDSVSRSDGSLLGLCVPKDSSKFLHVPDWKYKGSWPERRIKLQYNTPHHENDNIEEEVFKYIGNMANHILANQSSKSLSRLRNENPTYFTDVELFIRVQRILSVYHYRLTTRRFIHDLFDKVSFNTEAALSKLDSMKGLIHEVKSLHYSLHQTQQDEDELGEVMMKSALVSSSRRGVATGAIQATKSVAEVEEKIVMKPLHSSKGFF